MLDQKETSGNGQTPPVASVQTPTSQSSATPNVQNTQGLMGLAKVEPSGTAYKSYDPVKPADTRNGS